MMKILFEDPKTPVDLLVIAGEHSGDEHAASIVSKILKKNNHINVYAIGGTKLQESGAKLLFNLTEFSVVGLLEVTKHILIFRKLLQVTVDWIKKNKPKVLCLVDYPGFNLRLASILYKKKLSRKAGGDLFIYYYIGPQIWAWKAKRRFMMAKTIDSLGVIFPFEVDCYSDTDLDVHFVGHPFLEDGYNLGIKFCPSAPMLLLPGSRIAAVKRIFPIILNLFKSATAQNTKAIVLYPNETILQILCKHIVNHHLESRISLVSAGTDIVVSSAIMSSGTMSLKCALAGLPGIIVYKSNPITYFVGRRLVKIKYLGIANILLNEDAIPEFIQSRFADAIPYVSRLCNESTIEHAKINSLKIRKLLCKTSNSMAEDKVIEKIF
ncbi:MAG: lipid-A-disaccharide synthase [Puniceicoccales bacterium]|jgi:lipid-A-disaccharide synthase|nr:lipid-A-disaccharide synthase [Puniceicoccales bacterium]